MSKGFCIFFPIVFRRKKWEADESASHFFLIFMEALFPH